MPVELELERLYQRVAQETGSYLIPQVLKGIIDNPQHRQEDIIHPNARGQEILAHRVASALKPLLEKATYPNHLGAGYNSRKILCFQVVRDRQAKNIES